MVGFSLPFTGNSYQPVSQFPGHEDNKEAGHASNSCSKCGAYSGSKSSLNNWAIALCLICTLFNSLILLVPPSPVVPSCRDPLASLTKEDMRRLRRPSPYIGLEKIERPSPPVPRSIINYPQAIAQVDADHQSKIFDDDPLRYMTHTGSVSPEGKQVHVTKSVSTIVQFRAIDFGMERCELKLRLPEQNITSPFMISLHRLSSVDPIDTKALSYKVRPSRVTNIANIPVSPAAAVDWSEHYSCSWDELLTFEVACFDRTGYEGGDGECSLMWWQDQASDDPSQAIYMMQHATV